MARTAAKPRPSPVLHELQSLLWPENGIISELDLFLRLFGPAHYDDTCHEVHFRPEGTVAFDTAFNIFSIGKWARSCGLSDLRLRLDGHGTFELIVFQAIPDRSWERLVHRIVTPGPDCEVNLSHFARHPNCGVLYFTLRAITEGHLTAARWVTGQPPIRQPDLSLCVTTFRREEAVRATVARFEDYIARSPLAGRLHLIVVDNGQSAGIVPSANVTPIANDNLGGSGGFARGLIAAEARNATHCLFMDDDASVLMPALERVVSFLAYATDPATAVAGGLTRGDHRWQLWENGAVFDRWCRPQWIGTDLRDAGQVIRMELGSTGPKPANFYGGWWFFAFNVAQARYRPFPFFVRGDDISFSIANAFDIVTLPGVMTFPDADFSQKESLQTLYLDLRSHLIHHLALPQMDIGRIGAIGVPAWFFLRSLVQCHYETLAALNLSLEDVLRGPDFFAANADMSERRAKLSSLRKVEAWEPAPPPMSSPRHRINPHGASLSARFWRTTLNLTLNGHLLPFFGYWGNRITLAAGQRGDVPAIWGAAVVTYVAEDGTHFTVRHSKWKALMQSLRMGRNLLKLALRFRSIRAEWQGGYPRLASDTYWKQKFRITSPETAPRPKERPHRGSAIPTAVPSAAEQ